jgi:DNA-binding transcriptional MerR regulator
MIPNKSSFKFEELTPITGIKPYVLRYWETECPEIAPVISDSGHKIYSRKDLEIILKIKKLLFDDKMNIPTVKAFVSNEKMVAAELQEDVFTESYVSKILTPSLSDLRPYVETALNIIQEIKIKRNW